MNSVTLVAPRPLHPELALRGDPGLRLEPLGGDGGGLAVMDGTSRAYLVRDDYVIAELEPEERQAINAVLSEPVFYALSYSDLGLCRRVLFLIADDPSLLVDNGHGICLRGDVFLRRLRAEPDWDWRISRAGRAG